MECRVLIIGYAKSIFGMVDNHINYINYYALSKFIY
jgi:hypothetical protein